MSLLLLCALHTVMVTGASSNVGYMVQTPATPADGGLYGGHMKPGQGNGKGNMNTGEGRCRYQNIAPMRKRFKLSSSKAGELVGRGGRTLNGIRHTTGASISFTQNEIERRWRLVTVSGCRDSVGHAVRLIEEEVGWEHLVKLEVLCESLSAKHQLGEKIFDVPSVVAGQLIGRSGLHLNRIRHASDTSISFRTEARQGYRTMLGAPRRSLSIP